MANSEDFIQRLILDDSDFLKGMQNSTQATQVLEKEFEQATKTIKTETDKMAQSVVQGSDKIQKSNKDTVTAVNNTNAAMKRNQKEVAEVTLAIASSAGAGDKLQALFKKLEQVKLTGVTAEISNIEKEFEDLLSTVKLTDGQLDTLVNNIDEVAGSLAILSSDEFKELANDATKVTQEFVSAKTELKKLKDLINSGTLTGDELKVATTRAAELTDQIGDTNEKIKNLASDTRGIDTLIEGTRLITAGFALAEGASVLFGEENKEVQEALVKLNAIMVIQNSLQEAHTLLLQNSSISMKLASIQQGVYSTVIGTSTGALKFFRIALAATGVGLLVIGLIALITNFDKVKEAVTKTFPVLGRLGEIFNGLKDTFYGVVDGILAGFGVIGDVIGKIFDRDFSGAISSAKTLGKVMGDAITEGTKEATTDRLNKDLAKEIDGVVANQKKKVQLLQAGGKETANLQKTILQNELKALNLAKADKEAIQEKEFEIQLFNAERQKTLQDQSKKRRDEALSEFKRIQTEYENILKDKLNAKELFEFNQSAAVKSLETMRDELKKVGVTLKKDVSKEIDAFNEKIEGLSARKFSDTVDLKLTPIIDLNASRKTKLQSELKRIEDLEVSASVDMSTDKDKIKNELKKINQIASDNPIVLPSPKFAAPLVQEDTPFSERFDDWLSDINDFEDLYLSAIEGIFGDDAPAALAAISGADTFLDAFGSILNEATQLQLDAIDKQIDQVSKRRETLENDLQRELDLQNEGLANNVGTKQQEVDSLLAEEDRLQKEREKIQKEAQKRQLISDTITQTQSLITSSINIIKGFSQIPFIGLPLGIAAVGTLLGFFAKTKADAFKATKLYTGAERISDHFGYGQRHGETDLEGRGMGYRLVDEKSGKPTNVIISGREWMLPEDVSLGNEQFLRSLKTGIYNGIDLNEAVGFYKTFKLDGNKNGATVINNTQVVQATKPKTRQFITYTDKKGVTKGILMTIDDNMADGSEIILN